MGRLSRNVVALGFVSLFTDVASEVTLRTIPFYLLNVLDVDKSVVGAIEGVARALAVLTQLASGLLSDMTGKRKPLTLAGYGISNLVKPGLYLASSWPLVSAIRFLDRFGKGIRTAPRDALIADSVAPEDRGRAFGLHRTMDTIGSVLGLAIVASVVRWRLGDSTPVLDQGTFRALVLVASVPAVLSILVLALLVREGEAKPLARKFSLEGALPPQLRRYLVAVFFFNVSATSDAFFMLRAQELGVPLWETFVLVGIMSVVQAGLSYPAGVLSDRLGRRGLVAAGGGVGALQLLGFGFARDGVELALVFALAGLYLGLSEGNEKALLADLAPKELKATALGFYNLAAGLALLAASALTGELWVRFGPRVAFGAGALSALLAACLLAFVPPPRQAPAPSA